MAFVGGEAGGDRGLLHFLRGDIGRGVVARDGSREIEGREGPAEIVKGHVIRDRRGFGSRIRAKPYARSLLRLPDLRDPLAPAPHAHAPECLGMRASFRTRTRSRSRSRSRSRRRFSRYPDFAARVHLDIRHGRHQDWPLLWGCLEAQLGLLHVTCACVGCLGLCLCLCLLLDVWVCVCVCVCCWMFGLGVSKFGVELF